MSKRRAYDKLAARIVRKAKLNLGSTRKVIANDGSVKRKRLDKSGSTRKSIKAKITSKGIEVSGADHIKFLDQGVSGTKHSAKKSPFKRRKAPPKKALERMTRRMKPRDDKNQFAKDTKSARAGMQFAVGKSIREKGTPRTLFLTEAIEEVLKDIDDFIEDIADDIIDQIKDI